jgi:hypothetical protein
MLSRLVATVTRLALFPLATITSQITLQSIHCPVLFRNKANSIHLPEGKIPLDANGVQGDPMNQTFVVTKRR